ncbi:MAG: hypothetical protein ACRCRZ_01055 [Metamycoplasmataceae bacterium]
MKNETKILEYEKILKNFSDICKNANLWYSLGNLTLLSAINKSQNFIQNEYIEIFVTIDTLNYLKKMHPKNILDSSTRNNFYTINPFFIMKGIGVDIKLIIIVETTDIKLYKKIKNKQIISYYYNHFLNNKKHFNLKTFFIYNFLFKMLFFFPFKPLSYMELFDSLNDEKYRGFYLINNLSEKFSKNWIPNTTFKTKNIFFLNIEVPVFLEYQIFLIQRYGKNYENAPKLEKDIINYPLFK